MKYIIVFIHLFFFIRVNINAQQALDEAEKLFSDGKYSEAVSILEEFTNKNPNNQEAHYFLGYAYDKLNGSDGSLVNKSKIHFTLKASEHFKKVTEISPYYNGKILIQGPYSKLTSIWGCMAATYTFRGDLDSAIWAFNFGEQQGGFYPEILEYNKNVLATCAPNAILFTNGDNDTFPAWFLQLVENYRQDITIINCSLLNTPWYIQQLKHYYPFSTDTVAINMSDKQIEQLSPIEWRSKEVSIPIPKTTFDTQELMKIYDVTDSLTIHQGEIRFTMNNTLTSEDVRAIRVQDILVREIIESNNWERPIYFASTCSDDNKIGLQDYLRQDGLASKLVPQKRKTGEEFINVEVLNGNLKNYTFNFYKDEGYNYHDFQLLSQNYYNPFLRLAVYYQSKEEYQNVIHTLNYLDEKIPFNIVKMNNGLLFEIANFYFKSGDMNRFNEISSAVEENALMELESNPNDVSSYYNPYRILIEIYEKKEDYKNVILIWKKIETMYPNDSTVKTNIEKYKKLLLDSNK